MEKTVYVKWGKCVQTTESLYVFCLIICATLFFYFFQIYYLIHIPSRLVIARENCSEHNNVILF